MGSSAKCRADSAAGPTRQRRLLRAHRVALLPTMASASSSVSTHAPAGSAATPAAQVAQQRSAAVRVADITDAGGEGFDDMNLLQPVLVMRRPVVQMVRARLWRCPGAGLFAQAMEFIFERFGKLSLRNRAHVGRDECPVQETGRQRRMPGAQQAPCGMIPAQQRECRVVHVCGGRHTVIASFKNIRNAVRSMDEIVAAYWQQGPCAAADRCLHKGPCYQKSYVNVSCRQILALQIHYKTLPAARRRRRRRRSVLQETA